METSEVQKDGREQIAEIMRGNLLVKGQQRAVDVLLVDSGH
jgi:hypothetical protein